MVEEVTNNNRDPSQVIAENLVQNEESNDRMYKGGLEGFFSGISVSAMVSTAKGATARATIGGLIATEGVTGTMVKAAGGKVAAGVGLIIGTVDTVKYANYDQNIDATGAAVGAATATGVGIAGGIAGGAAVGAAAGSVVPVVGTIIGGVVGGLVGWWAGNKVGKIAAEAAGAKNKYTAVLSLEDVEEKHREYLIQQGHDLSKIGEKAIAEDLKLHITALQDKGYAIVNDSKSNWFADQVGATDLIPQTYADFDGSATLAALRINLRNFSTKDGAINPERFAEYKRKFAEQMDALIAKGELTGMTNDYGNPMHGEEAKAYLMNKLDMANTGYVDGQNRGELFADSLGKLGTLTFAQELARETGPVSDKKLMEMLRKEAQELYGTEMPRLSQDELDGMKMELLRVNPNIKFEKGGAVFEEAKELLASRETETPILQGPKKAEKGMFDQLFDMLKDFLVAIPVIGVYLKDFLESDTPLLQMADAKNRKKGAAGREEDTGAYEEGLEYDGEEVELEGDGFDLGDEDYEEVAAAGQKLDGATRKGRELKDDGAVIPDFDGNDRSDRTVA